MLTNALQMREGSETFFAGFDLSRVIHPAETVWALPAVVPAFPRDVHPCDYGYRAQTGISDAIQPDPTGDPASKVATSVRCGPLSSRGDSGRRRAGSPP